MNNWKKFASNEMQTAGPVQITMYLYQHALLLMRKSKKTYDENLFEEGNALIEKVLKILYELGAQLNRDSSLPEEVKETIHHMDITYLSAQHHLEKARDNKRGEDIDVSIELISNLLEGYKGNLTNGQKK